jgi:hypothetical protein
MESIVSIRGYIFRQMSNVPGYMDPSDALLFSAILTHQNREKLAGGAAEIGVYFGRSYFLLRKLMLDGERVFAADLFSIGAHPNKMSDQYRSFLRSARKLGLEIDESLIHRGDSRALSGDDVAAKVGPVRFFSIDGGHMLEHVKHDSIVARDSLAEHGVIAFDDAFNFEWPEVALGLFQFLQDNDDYLPFASTQKKTYICHKSFHQRYLEVVERAADLSGFHRKKGTFLDTPVIFIHHAMPKRIAHAALTRAGAGRFAGMLYPTTK